MNEPQIKYATAFLMIFTALCFDGIQALIGWVPVVGNILAGLFSIFIFLTFMFWFWTNGIMMITPKRLTSMIGGGLIELIPYVNILPAWTCVVIYLIGTTKVKELAQKHPTLAKGAILVGGKIKEMNKTGQDPHVPFVDKKINYAVAKNPQQETVRRNAPQFSNLMNSEVTRNQQKIKSSKISE